MKGWWQDTLFKRLFLLMWLALVASHLVAVQVIGGGGPGLLYRMAGPGMMPGPPMMPRHVVDGGREDGRFGEPFGGPPPMHWQPSGWRLALDYTIRFLVIGLASWWGARWLAAPMRRLVHASHTLASGVGNRDRLPSLDEHEGTVEVREAAHVFNAMADQLDTQFRNRGLMIAAISHDLRTPLTRMRIRLESLQHEPAAQRCVGDVQEMNDLIDTVLEAFRSDGHGEPPQATDTLSLAQALTDDLAEQGQPVTCHGAPATAMVQPAALRRVLSNLVGNALRYGNTAAIDVRPGADGIVIHVDDTGPGIPASRLESVFEPFFAGAGTPRRNGSTGLGLYIARDLVKRQGGSLLLANRPEGGLRATVTLPRAG